MKEEDFTVKELEKIVQDKAKENTELLNQIAKLEQENTNMANRALKVHAENEMIKSAPGVAAEVAKMNYQLTLAKTFIDSGAFPKAMTPEQAFTVMKAGGEMGLREVESLQTLYIVNGAIKPYGDKMIARLILNGYRVEYLEEKEESVKVRVYHPGPEIDFDVTEIAHKDDQALKNSRAKGFSLKNKLRFHGVRMVVSFHLPHLFTSVSDFFQEDAVSYDKERKNRLDPEKVENTKERERIVEHLENATTPEELNAITGDVVERYNLHEEMNAAGMRIADAMQEAADDQNLFTQIQDNEQGEQTKK